MSSPSHALTPSVSLFWTGILTPHRALRPCWSLGGPKLHAFQDTWRLNFLHDILVIVRPVQPLNDKARLSRDPREASEQWLEGGKGGKHMASVFNLLQVTQQVLGPRAEVPRSTLPLQTREDLESRLPPTRRPPSPAPTLAAPPLPLPASVRAAVKAAAGVLVSPAASQRSSQATAQTPTALAARTLENALPKGARGDEKRTEEPAHALCRS